MRPGLLKGEWEQGGWYTGPSPLGDSPAVILCLDEPFTSPFSSSSPLSPYSGHTPLPPSICSPFHHLLILRWGPTHTPKNTSTSKGPWRELSPLGLYWEAAFVVVIVRPPLSRLSPPCGRPLVCQSQKGGTLKTMTHTLVKYHGSFQSPLMGTNRVSNFWAWSMFCLFYFFVFLLVLYVDFAFNATRRERSDIRTIQSMAAYGVFFPRSRPSDPEIVLPIRGPRDTAILPSCVFRGRLFRQGFYRQAGGFCFWFCGAFCFDFVTNSILFFWWTWPPICTLSIHCRRAKITRFKRKKCFYSYLSSRVYIHVR